MLGLGRSLFSHLWPRGGSARRLKKQVRSPLGSLMLRFTDSKLKRKPDSEINVSERRSPGKACMADTVINMPDGQCGQRVFFPPSGEGRSHQREAVRRATEQTMTPAHTKDLLRVQSRALLHLTITGTVPLSRLVYRLWLRPSKGIAYQVETIRPTSKNAQKVSN